MIKALSTAERLLARAGIALEHHPKQVTAVLAAVLLCGGGGAFAVASISPDSSDLPPPRLVVQDVEPLPLSPQAEALGGHRFLVFSSEQTRSSDTVDSLLSRLGVHDAAAAAYLQANRGLRNMVLGAAGRTVRAEANDDGTLVRLTARWATADVERFERLVIERQTSGKFAARIEKVPYTTSPRMGAGSLKSSLFAATDEAGLPDAVTVQLIAMFEGEIDFHRGLQKGDRFNVIYEVLEADGEVMKVGRVLTAEFVNGGKTFGALWYQQPGSTAGAYYGFDGKSLERTFLASPMEVSRVTSGFAMRFHPIHHTWRAHKGVDYGAPTGTAVRSVADGRVEFAGWQGGYGNVVQIDHGKGDVTVYAHLSRVDVKVGQRIGRGQTIGGVGSTGWATGPHLHFEFRENGVHRDPLEVARQSQRVELAASARPDFDRVAGMMRMHLAAGASRVTVASAQ